MRLDSAKKQKTRSRASGFFNVIYDTAKPYDPSDASKRTFVTSVADLR